jgi:hypothetical protein
MTDSNINTVEIQAIFVQKRSDLKQHYFLVLVIGNQREVLFVISQDFCFYLLKYKHVFLQTLEI